MIHRSADSQPPVPDNEFSVPVAMAWRGQEGWMTGRDYKHEEGHFEADEASVFCGDVPHSIAMPDFWFLLPKVPE